MKKNNEKFPFRNFDCGAFDQLEQHIFDMIEHYIDYYHIGLTCYFIITHPTVESITTYNLSTKLICSEKTYQII